MHHRALSIILAAICLSWIDATAQANVTLNHLFADHMVLQQGLPVPIWGQAAPGEKITVQFKGQTKSAVADASGNWMTRLDPLKASAEPADLVVQSAIRNPQSAIHDVLVGEVWLCSGQSNMEFPVERATNAASEIAAATFSQIRMFTVKKVVAFEPRDNVDGAWQVCSPDTVKTFSAVAYFFGRELHQRLTVPIGLVHASQGWTPAEAWMSRESLLSAPALAYLVHRWDEVTTEAAVAKAAGRPPKTDPQFMHRAAGMWNGSVAPLVPYAVRGVIWYQGESNDSRGYQYRQLFPVLIGDWRRAWGQARLPFLFVQVASVLPPDPAPVESEWAELRESQALALALPETGMAVTIDIGEEKDVHPKNKQDVGHRLALLARARVYGERLVDSGPIYRSLKIEGRQIRLTFDHLGSGLMTPHNEPLRTFAIAGSERKFVPAEAKIDGDSVIVGSDQVPAPVAVRYAWANNPAGCNLFNKEGLPAAPFRTDDWPAKTQNTTKLYID